MEEKIKGLIIDALAESHGINEDELNEIGLELSRNANNDHGDFSSNIALKLASKLKSPPMKLAEEIIGSLETPAELELAECVKPGFINFYLSAEKKHSVLETILKHGRDFGSSCAPEKMRILLEFVSANPTGPLHVGHGRHAAFGDSLARLLKKAGHEVFTEYYLNDAGRQIDILCLSVILEMLRAEGLELKNINGLYKGIYIKEISQALIKEGFEINKKVLIPKLDGSADEIVDALILEIKNGRIIAKFKLKLGN